MNETKLATAPVDAERVVRELLRAFKSLKTIPAPPTCSSASEEGQQQSPPQSHEDRSKVFRLVGSTLSNGSMGLRKPAKLQATVPPEALHVPDEYIKPSMPDFSEMAERIRHEAFPRLTGSDSLRGVDRRSPIRQFIFSLALVLMAAVIGSFMHHLQPKIGRVLLSGEILFVASLIVGIYLRWSRSLTRSSGRI